MPSRRLAVPAACALALAFAAAAPPAGARTVTVKAPDADRCDWLDGSACLQPFPNDFFTVRDRRTATGVRLRLRREAMPRNTQGVPIDPTDMNRGDGFSPGSTLIVKVPGLESAAAVRRSRLVPQTDLARHADRRQGVVVIDARTLRRHPVWAETDSEVTSDADRNLLIRPARQYLQGHRYIVALRGLRGADGRRLRAPLGFRVYRDGLRTRRRAVERRRPHMRALLRTLARAGIPSRDLYLAWDFTIASQRSITGRALAIRDDAFATLGDTTMADGRPQGRAPAFRVTSVRDFAPCDPSLPSGNPAGCNRGAGRSADLLRQVEGTYEVPCYLTSPGCVPGGTFRLDARGLPLRTPGNTMQARFVCNIPRAAASGPALLPALYGHGLFGDIGEARGSRNVHQLGNENRVLVCATDFSGMADEDVVASAVPALADLSKFDRIADRLQQGFLNFLFLGRLLRVPGGLASAPAFSVGGRGVVDTSAVAYYGNSQGGILGGPVTALSPDVRNAVLYVPGMNYSILLPRSVDFDEPDTTADFAGVLAQGYPLRADRPLVYALMQLLWDRGEPAGYAERMAGRPLPRTPSHRVLIEMAFGDHQVANVTAEAEARTIGARLRRPGLDPGRSLDRTPFWGLPALRAGSAPQAVFNAWDIGPLRTQDGRRMGTPPPPVGNVPPKEGQDPHDYVIENSPAIRRQIADWMRTGRFTEVCGAAPCRTPDWAGPMGARG